MADYDKPAEDDIRRCLSYDPETGTLTWRVTLSSTGKVGSIAGCLNALGYRVIRVNRKLYLGHRIAWLLHHGEWPERDIDHINMDKGDNRLVNLRLATRSQNVANSSSRMKLPKGCYQLKGRKRWYSQICVNGVVNRLGTFDTVEEAAAAFKRAHMMAHGAFSYCEVNHERI